MVNIITKKKSQNYLNLKRNSMFSENFGYGPAKLLALA